METITLSKKSYVVVEQKRFEQLQRMAASKVRPQKRLSLEEGRKKAHQLINKWANENNNFRRSYYNHSRDFFIY